MVVDHKFSKSSAVLSIVIFYNSVQLKKKVRGLCNELNVEMLNGSWLLVMH